MPSMYWESYISVAEMFPVTEMHIDDWMIARLLGHKTLQSVHHYRKIGNKIMADETRAVREKIDMILMDVVKEWDGYEI